MTIKIGDDKIRDIIVDRAEELGLTAYAISRQCDGTPGEEAVRRYLQKRCSLNTRYVSRICKILSLELRPAE